MTSEKLRSMLEEKKIPVKDCNVVVELTFKGDLNDDQKKVVEDVKKEYLEGDKSNEENNNGDEK